ncbi:MAG: phospholipid carrier-dependent glycosyltransferase [Chloroflexi bacterium]|nr:MAG: phospholipid carrier-dependent glycosyltransferase [Chloroflexota bacterium]
MPFRSKFNKHRLFDAVWLLLLIVYVIAGIKEASFHGDEAMQIYMSNDYATAFIYRQPRELMTEPPYDIDADAQLRILNGSVNRYAIGLSWHLAGLTTGDLPPAPGWDWGLSYERNVETGHRPSDELLLAARASSTLFLALSAVVMFAIGWQFGGRLPAYLISAIYVLNPVVLLNGRRAMQEGAFLFFGLLTVFIAISITRRQERAQAIRWWWAGLVLAGALALASKHSAAVFVTAAFGWIFVAQFFRTFNRRDVLQTTGKLLLSGLVVIVLFVAMSPALWSNPIARFVDLIAERRTLIDIQVTAHTDGAMNFVERVEALIMQPFVEPTMHFEVASWRDAEAIVAESQHFDRSPLSGIRFGRPFGWLLTALSIAGLMLLLLPRGVERVSHGQAAGVLVWLVVTAASLLLNPLPWQRYYLPLIPILALFAGITLTVIIRLIVQKRKQNHQPIQTPLRV